MFLKRVAQCPEVLAEGGYRLRELLEPEKDGVDLPYSLAWAEVASGSASPRLRPPEVQVYYVLEGGGLMHVGPAQRAVCAGDLVLVPAGVERWVENPGFNRLVLAVISSPPRGPGTPGLAAAEEAPCAGAMRPPV